MISSSAQPGPARPSPSNSSAGLGTSLKCTVTFSRPFPRKIRQTSHSPNLHWERVPQCSMSTPMEVTLQSPRDADFFDQQNGVVEASAPLPPPTPPPPVLSECKVLVPGTYRFDPQPYCFSSFQFGSKSKLKTRGFEILVLFVLGVGDFSWSVLKTLEHSSDRRCSYGHWEVRDQNLHIHIRIYRYTYLIRNR